MDSAVILLPPPGVEVQIKRLDEMLAARRMMRRISRRYDRRPINRLPVLIKAGVLPEGSAV